MPTAYDPLPWHMIIGNDPSGKKPWTGKIHGLALYNQALSPREVAEHFEKWAKNSVRSLTGEKGIIALYAMDEQKGQILHNAVSNSSQLSLPAKFTILKKNFLEISANAFKLSGSSLRDMCINIFGFIPLGFLLFVSFYSPGSSWTSSWRLILLAVTGGAVLSAAIEILQAYLPARDSSLTDLIFNTLGTGIGTIFAVVYDGFVKRRISNVCSL